MKGSDWGSFHLPQELTPGRAPRGILAHTLTLRTLT